MKSNKIIEFLGKAEIFTKKNSPAILSGLAIMGVISTAYSAYKAGPKAEKILENYRKDMKDCYPDDKDAKKAVIKETAKEIIPVIAPSIIMGGSTIACIFGSHSISNRRIAVLSAAYSLSESTVKNLNNKMEEILGEKKARAIKDSIMKDKLRVDSEKDQKVLSDNSFIMATDGMVLCKDMHSGRLFHSNAQKIETAINKCSYRLLSEMYISLNDFYDEIESPELPPIPMGNTFGWNVEDTRNGQLPIVLTALLLDNKMPCLCIDYDVSLRNDYRNLH